MSTLKWWQDNDRYIQEPFAEIVRYREEVEKMDSENAALRRALQSIADEAVNHHETNLVSGITRLPRGYRNILNIAAAAIDAARKGAQP